VRTAKDLALTAAAAPYTAAKVVQGVIALQRPYLDFRRAESSLALGGGFSRQRLQSAILQGTPLLPGANQNPALTAGGLGPRDVLELNARTGVMPLSAESTVNVASSIRAAALSPGMGGLNESQLARLLGNARNLGIVRGGTPRALDLSATKYFDQLQWVTSTATMQGFDASRFSQAFSQALQLGGRVGTANTSSMAAFFSRMSGGGTAEMRSGTGEVGLLSDLQAASRKFGAAGHPTQNMMLFSAMGGKFPTSDDALRRKLGLSKAQFQSMTATPIAQQALLDYKQAVQSGDLAGAAQYLGLLVNGDPTAMQHLFQQSAFGRAFKNNPELRGRVRASLFGTSLERSLGFDATLPSQGAGRGKFAPPVSADLLRAATAASQATGVPVEDILAVSAAESGNNPAAHAKGSTATGAFQVTRGTAARFGFTQADMYDVNKGAMVAARRLQEAHSAANAAGRSDTNYALAMAAYHEGQGRMGAILAGNVSAEGRADVSRFERARRQYSNMPIPELQRLATSQTADVQGSQYIYESSNAVIAVFRNIVGEGDKLAQTFSSIGGALRGALGGGHMDAPMHHSMSPGMIPLDALPGSAARGAPSRP
jgi:soluble lytic murein transglycosylase-like protein